VRPVSFHSALGDVAVEQVHAAGVTQFADLDEQGLDGHGGIGGAPGTQVIAVGVHQRRPVLRRADHPLRFGGAGIALDRVQRQPQPP
jgi:hypothetical protein